MKVVSKYLPEYSAMTFYHKKLIKKYYSFISINPCKENKQKEISSTGM